MTTINLSNMKSNIRNISRNDVIVYTLMVIYFLDFIYLTVSSEQTNKYTLESILIFVFFIIASYIDYRRGINIYGLRFSGSLCLTFTFTYSVILWYVQGKALLSPLFEQNYMTYLEPVNIINCIIYSLVVTFSSISIICFIEKRDGNASIFYSTLAVLIATFYDHIKSFL